MEGARRNDSEEINSLAVSNSSVTRNLDNGMEQEIKHLFIASEACHLMKSMVTLS